MNLKQDLEYQMSNRVLELKRAIEEENSVLHALQVMSDEEWYLATPEWRRNVETRYGDIQIIKRSIQDMEAEVRSFCNVVGGVY